MKSTFSRNVARALVAAAFIGSAPSAYADIYHYNNILIGDRAAGMGGAYTAVSDDPSGLFYNPAGVAHAGGASINGSMNAYHYTYTEYKDVLGNESWTRESTGLVPTFFGIIQPFAGGMVGLSIVVTDAVFDDQDQHFEDFTPAGGILVDDYYINFNNQDTTYNAGPSYALKINDHLTLGATLYGHYRKQQLILNQQVYFSDSTQVWTNDYFQIEEFGINPVFGLMWTPLERLSLGISVRKTWILRSRARLQSTAKAVTDTVIALPSVATSSEQRDLPVLINAGAAYFASDRLLVTADVSWSQATDSANSVVNFALGTEYYLYPQWALRAGVFSNMSNTPELNSTSQGQKEHIDLFGGSASLCRFTRNSSLSVGVTTSVGTGKAQMVRGVTTIQDMSAQSLTTFIAVGNSF